MNITDIDINFNEEILNHKGLVIVDFWAPWCGPCKMFSPIFEKVSNSYKNIKFCKFNIDQDKDGICKKYGIMSIPTIMLFENGKELKKKVGFLDEEKLKNFLKNI